MLPQSRRRTAPAGGRGNDDMRTDDNAKFLVIGHRGAAGIRPENTLAAFRKAVSLGVDGVELDVQCVEGELLVFHDDRLERTTDGRGRLEDATFESVRRLDAGAGERVPTLREALAAVPSSVLVNVELKGRGTAVPAARLLRGLRRPIVVSSFDHQRLAVFREHCPRTPVAPLAGEWTAGLPATVQALRAWGVHIAARLATAARVAAVKSWGCRCLVYTVNSAGRARRLRALGVDGVFTDFPDRLSGAC